VRGRPGDACAAALAPCSDRAASPARAPSAASAAWPDPTAPYANVDRHTCLQRRAARVYRRLARPRARRRRGRTLAEAAGAAGRTRLAGPAMQPTRAAAAAAAAAGVPRTLGIADRPWRGRAAATNRDDAQGLSEQRPRRRAGKRRRRRRSYNDLIPEFTASRFLHCLLRPAHPSPPTHSNRSSEAYQPRPNRSERAREVCIILIIRRRASCHCEINQAYTYRIKVSPRPPHGQNVCVNVWPSGEFRSAA
jgi:hypothetical protein